MLYIDRKSAPLPPTQDFALQTANHRLKYQSGGPILVVSFEDSVRAEASTYDIRSSWGEEFYRQEGHSLLGVIARTNDWYRCSTLIKALCSLSEQGFFKQFEKVIMIGTSMGGVRCRCLRKTLAGMHRNSNEPAGNPRS